MSSFVIFFIAISSALVSSLCVAQESNYLGNLNNNPFDLNSIANQYGLYGNVYSPNSIYNPNSPYGNPFNNKSAMNPYATDAPKLYDQNGNYRGRLSVNPYDPDSISNPFGQFGNPHSLESIHNPFGAGNPLFVISIYGQ
jgi:hypothetical protein